MEVQWVREHVGASSGIFYSVLVYDVMDGWTCVEV